MSKLTGIFFTLAIAFTSFGASAYYPQWQYDGQRQGPIHGSPWGINYCGTEYPQYCDYYQRGQVCYVNNGYWWDNVRQVNWFNTYRCR